MPKTDLPWVQRSKGDHVKINDKIDVGFIKETNDVIDPTKTMQLRMLRTQASPMKKRLSAELQERKSAGSDVYLHIYDLGPLSKWTLNGWGSKENGTGVFHCGIEVLGVEWSFQGVTWDDDDLTGVMCHTPKANPLHEYRETIWLGGSPLCAYEICKVLAKLERDWPARSYHFLTHNCTDFAECLAQSLDVPHSFPTWAHGLAKGIAKKDDGNGSNKSNTGWLPTLLGGCCGSQSRAGAYESQEWRLDVQGIDDDYPWDSPSPTKSPMIQRLQQELFQNEENSFYASGELAGYWPDDP